MWFSGALNPPYWKAVGTAVEQLGFDEVEVILYLRRQDRFIESLWNQFVKATEETRELERYIATPRARALCDYYAGVKRIEDEFGKSAVRIGVYERSALRNGDAIDDFCYRVGLPADSDWERPHAKQENPRLNNNLVELKRIVNRSEEYHKLNNVFGPAFAHAMAGDDWTERTELLSPETRSNFLARFKKGNKLLAKEYFAGKDLFRAPRDDDALQWEFEAENMLRDAVLVMADMLALQQRQINDLHARLARLENA